MEETPQRRECEGCRLRPAIGILTMDDGEQVHLCQFCVPNSPIFDFRVYPHLVAE